MLGPGGVAWKSAHGNLLGRFIAAACAAIPSPPAVPELPNVQPCDPCSHVLHKDSQLFNRQPRPSTQGTSVPQFALPESAQLKKPCFLRLWALDLYVNLSKTGFVMHLTLATRRKKNTTLDACLVYDHFKSSVSLQIFMVSTSVKTRSQMTFRGDGLAVVKIMIFCKNQSSYLTDKWSPCALLKMMS